MKRSGRWGPGWGESGRELAGSSVNRAIPRPALLAHFEEVVRGRPFRPPLWLRQAHLQTVAGALWRRNFPWGCPFSREEVVDLEDGSRIRALVALFPQGGRTLVALHGMGGSSESLYMRGFLHKAYRRGWNAVLLNFHNCASRGDPKLFDASASDDLAQVLSILTRRLLLKTVCLVGVSLGGNIVLKMLGEGSAPVLERIESAAVISPLVDLEASWPLLEKPANRLFQDHFVRGFKERIRHHREDLEGRVEVEALLGIRTIREFDRLCTVPLGGFSSLEHYYREASARPHLGSIRTPTLCLHARDDPLLPWQPLADPAVQHNPNLLVHFTERGGHVGFLQRRTAGDVDRFWAENRVLDFFSLPAG